MVKKIKFIEIELPLVNQKIELRADSEEQLVGRTVKIDLTRKLRGKSLEIIFKIEQDKDKLKPTPQRLHLLGYYIRRMIRKSASYIEDSFKADSKDGALQIKPFLIARHKISRKVKKALRNQAKIEIENMIKTKKHEEVFEEIIAGTLQKDLSGKLKKIYPLALCEIRDIFIKKLVETRREKKEEPKGPKEPQEGPKSPLGDKEKTETK